MTDEQRKRIHEVLYSTDSREELAGRIVRLEDENAKLRKFATETIRLMQADGPDCGLCKHYDECWADEATNYSPTGCIICNEARELGIEALPYED